MNKDRADARFTALTIAEAEEILKRWMEPHRRWHSAVHLINLLKHIGEDSDLTDSDREMLRYVALFHDAIYTPLDSDNEEKSAKMAAYYLEKYPRKDEVVAAILATKKHESRTKLEEKFNAWDCAILRETNWESLKVYEKAIAYEFKEVNRKTYLRERVKFLRQAAIDYKNPLLAKLADELEVPPFWSAQILREDGVQPH